MEPRKASDILLDLEKKIDIMLNIIRTQDMNIKILSNKLNSLQEVLGKENLPSQKIMVEAVNMTHAQAQIAAPFQQNSLFNNHNQIPISSDFNLPLEKEPQGFRRTSRPETFSGDDVYLPKKNLQAKNEQKIAVPNNPSYGPPPGRVQQDDVIVSPIATQKLATPITKQQPLPTTAQNAIPVMQRVVNGHGRSLFLADVEIVDLTTMSSSKTRTNGSGKWMASLTVGNYRVLIKKYESATKETLESTQEIMVDGSQSPLELPAVIIKSR